MFLGSKGGGEGGDGGERKREMIVVELNEESLSETYKNLPQADHADRAKRYVMSHRDRPQPGVRP